MIRGVMEREERVHVRVEPEVNHATEGAVAPTNVLRVFLVGILRVHYCEVAALEKLDHLCALGCGKIARFFLADSIARSQVQLQRFVRLVIWEVGDGSRPCEETVPGTNPWMISKLGTHLDFPNLKVHFL